MNVSSNDRPGHEAIEPLANSSGSDVSHSSQSSRQSNVSNASSSNADRKKFGYLVDIPKESLVQLAIDIRQRQLNTSTHEAKHIDRIIGGYNIAHIIQLDDLKLVIRTSISSLAMTDAAKKATVSQDFLLGIIGQQTTIPVPAVYDWCLRSDNIIGAPYICFSFVPGKPVMKVWYDKDMETETREQLRLNILKSLAQIMPQFSKFAYSQIGSISSRSRPLDPCYFYEDNEDGVRAMIASGPFDSLAEYLEVHYYQTRDPKDEDDVYYTKAEEIILSHLLANSEIYDKKESFVLHPPDFNPQNVMVDEHGNVTGLIDWDEAITVPRCVGNASYPNWITRDWEQPEIDSEDSPETLQRYRAYYCEELGKALNWEGDWKYTKKSHITKAIWFALQYPVHRLDICHKFVKVALGITDRYGALGVLYDIGAGAYEDLDDLLAKLTQITSLDSKLPHEL